MGSLKKNPLMERLRKKVTLEDRLKMHYLFEFINNNDYANQKDYQIAQLYSEEKTADVMKIIREWEEHGSPK